MCILCSCSEKDYIRLDIPAQQYAYIEIDKVSIKSASGDLVYKKDASPRSCKVWGGWVHVNRGTGLGTISLGCEHNSKEFPGRPAHISFMITGGLLQSDSTYSFIIRYSKNSQQIEKKIGFYYISGTKEKFLKFIEAPNPTGA